MANIEEKKINMTKEDTLELFDEVGNYFIVAGKIKTIADGKNVEGEIYSILTDTISKLVSLANIKSQELSEIYMSESEMLNLDEVDDEWEDLSIGDVVEDSLDNEEE